MDGEVAKLTAELYHLERRCKEAKASLATIEEERNGIRARLADLVAPGIVVHAGGVQVKRVACKRRETFSLSAAKKAGVFDEALLAPFVSVGEPFDRWYVDRVGDVAPENFGDEVPF